MGPLYTAPKNIKMPTVLEFAKEINENNRKDKKALEQYLFDFFFNERNNRQIIGTLVIKRPSTEKFYKLIGLNSHIQNDVLKNRAIMELFDKQGFYAVKTMPTLLRLPYSDEIGQEIKTYIKDERGQVSLAPEQESVTVTVTVTESDVIASNVEVVGEVNGTLFLNTWLIKKSQLEELYGDITLSYEYKPYTKIRTVRCLTITEEVLDYLGSTDGKTAFIKDSSSNEMMEVYLNGVLTDSGYGINPYAFMTTYSVVD